MLTRVLLLITILGIGVGCGEAEQEEAWIARVDGRSIPTAHFEAEVARALARYQQNGTPVPPAIERALRAHLLGRMIDDEVLHQQALAMELHVEERALDAAVAERKERFRSEASYAAHVKERYGSEAEARAALRRRLLIERALDELGRTLEVTSGAGADGCDEPGTAPAEDAQAARPCRTAPEHLEVRRRRAVLASLKPSVRIERQGGAAAPVVHHNTERTKNDANSK